MDKNNISTFYMCRIFLRTGTYNRFYMELYFYIFLICGGEKNTIGTGFTCSDTYSVDLCVSFCSSLLVCCFCSVVAVIYIYIYLVCFLTPYH